MTEGSLRTSGTAGSFADAKSQSARGKSCWIVVLDHQPGGLRLHDLAADPQELSQKCGHVRRGSVGASPGSTQLPPVRTVPVPLLCLRIAPPRFGCSTFHLAGYHLF